MGNGVCPFTEFIKATADPNTGEALVDAFLADPYVVGDDHDLSTDQIDILLGGDRNGIRAELAREAEDHPECAKSHQWAPFGLMT
ncbi:MAG: hypothetical protein QNJ75_13745 [Acidimicrobiia bacterium]|nr:hypothetical protein [Acidimicrobiia bacterium]